MRKRARSTGKKQGVPRRVNATPPFRGVSKNLSTSPVLTPSRQTSGNATLTSAGVKLLVDRIDRETVIGDLIVAFPWTREVLQKYGLRLEVEEAGDIYMSLETFAALRNLKPESLLRELVDASKQPPQPPQPAPPLITTPIT